jgi:hypothetical protein
MRVYLNHKLNKGFSKIGEFKMKVEYIKHVNVTPFVTNDSGAENAQKIGESVKKFSKNHPDREIYLHDYKLVDRTLLFLVSGNIGNLMDAFKASINEYGCTLQVVSDIEATKILNFDGCGEYYELNSSLLSIFSE